MEGQTTKDDDADGNERSRAKTIIGFQAKTDKRFSMERIRMTDNIDWHQELPIRDPEVVASGPIFIIRS